MRPCRPLSLAVLLYLLATYLPNAAGAAESSYRRFNLSLGYHYSSGTYGTSETTEIAYVPLTATAEIGRWSLQGTVPYLRISGPAGFATGPNGPIQTTSGESDGLGDVLARGSYLVPPDTSWMPFVELIGRVKFPTASRAAGLGTGEFDVGFETELSWSVRRVSPFVNVGYRYLGSPPGFPLHDVYLGSAGAQYRWLDALNVGLLLDYRTAASVSSGARLELVPFASWKLDTRWSVDLYASTGFAKGSPDAGVGLQIGYTFSHSDS